MNYQEALDYLYGFGSYERAGARAYPRLEEALAPYLALLEALGNPQRWVPSVLVAGTKGKGSTAAMLASILGCAGYRVGLYTSPHLHSFRERMRVGDEPVSQEELVALVEHSRPALEVALGAGEGRPTTFEVATALAFCYFCQKRVDLQLLEVGLGGRLDATNVVPPLTSVITPISFDHVEVLGYTLEEIAREKAGVIKNGACIVMAPQEQEAERVIEGVCRERKAKLTRVGSEVRFEQGMHSLEGQSCTVETEKGCYDLTLGLLGQHQVVNAAVAVAVAESLAPKGVPVARGAIVEGLRRVRWPGRFEVLQRRPWVVVDGAQNAASARALSAALGEYFTYERLWLVLGTSVDKDVAGIVGELAPLAAEVIATRSCHPRAGSPAVVAEETRRLGVLCRETASVGQAFDLALSEASPGDLICAAGSLFVAAEVIERYRQVSSD